MEEKEKERKHHVKEISPMKRLIGYARVSTDNQKEEGTIQIQHRALQEYSETNGYALVRVFSDEGISGSKDLEHRPGLAEMFDYLESHADIGGVLIFKLDRLARDLYIQEHLLRKLQDMNKTLISIKEPDICSNDPMRKAFRQFMGIVSELEKSFITMRLSGGRINKARKGGYGGGCPAMGYKAADKELVIDAVAAETIKTIFTLRMDRKLSLREIANHLNDSGTTTARGRKWYAGTVKYVLDNPIYKGLVAYSGIKIVRASLSIIQ
jgi:site-specific DNA recombinase